MSFSTLNLSAELVRAIADQGYTEPTPIQAQAIPVILAGRDLLAAAQTGTGKTAAFTLPMLQRLSTGTPGTSPPRANGRSPRALILTPTRELAAQVGEDARTYGRYLPLGGAMIYGGVSIRPQIERLRRGVDILVATPGRLLDHVTQRTVDLSRIEILVLDEADRMLDMGFIPDVRRILGLLPKPRQTLLFSATFPNEIRELSKSFLNNPQTVEVAARNAPTTLVNQRVHWVDRGQKRALLLHLIVTEKWGQTLVFARTKHGANRLAEQLEHDGLRATAIHGNKSQGARTRALADFKSGRVRVLVATDIASRGIDIDQLPQVVNYELPLVPEDYVHRIGRTGRAGNSGEAISLVSAEEVRHLKDIQRLLGRTLPASVVEGFEPTQKPSTQPSAARPARPRAQADRGQKPAYQQRPGNPTGRQPPRQGERRYAR